MQAAIARDQRIDVRIVERTHHDLHGMALQRMEERTDLPAAEDVRSAAARLCRASRPLRNFQSPDRPRSPTHSRACSLETGRLRPAVVPAKRKHRAEFRAARPATSLETPFKIAKSHASQSRMQSIDQPPIRMPTPCASGRGSNAQSAPTTTTTSQYCNLSSIEGFDFDGSTRENARSNPGGQSRRNLPAQLANPKGLSIQRLSYRIACITGHEGSKEPE